MVHQSLQVFAFVLYLFVVLNQAVEEVDVKHVVYIIRLENYLKAILLRNEHHHVLLQPRMQVTKHLFNLENHSHIEIAFEFNDAIWEAQAGLNCGLCNTPINLSRLIQRWLCLKS